MNKAVMIAVLLLLVLSSFVLAQEDTSSDCNWLCQVLNWFKGEGNVVGKAE